MATKVETFTKTTYKHKFYCDECGEYLGLSVEYIDGYVPKPNGVCAIDLDIDIGDTTLYFKRDCICKQCYLKNLGALLTSLRAIGFREEEDQ